MTTRLPCSLRALLALSISISISISISTMARARRSQSALSWPLVNGMAGAAASGLQGPAGGGHIRRCRPPRRAHANSPPPIMNPCRRSSDDEAAGPGRAARPLQFAPKEENGRRRRVGIVGSLRAPLTPPDNARSLPLRTFSQRRARRY
jgi:hypothetical protein